MMLTRIHSTCGRAKTFRFLANWLAVRPLFMLGFFLLSLSSIVHAADVTLTWDDPGNDSAAVDGYNLYYWQSGTPSTKVDVGPQTNHTLTGLTDGQTYSFAVTAYDSNSNESSLSTEISETVGTSNNVPVANNGTLSVAEGAVGSGTLTIRFGSTDYTPPAPGPDLPRTPRTAPPWASQGPS